MYDVRVPNGRIRFRDTSEKDAYLIAKWRNTQSARDSFFNTEVVTPDTHRLFIKNRQPHDLVWIIQQATGFHYDLGIISLKIDVKKHTGEYGRLYLDPAYRGNGYALEAEYLLMWASFEWLNLESIWLDIYEDRTKLVETHLANGYKIDGKDLPGHCDPRKPVLYMTCDRQTWAKTRLDFVEKFGVELGEWDA